MQELVVVAVVRLRPKFKNQIAAARRCPAFGVWFLDTAASNRRRSRNDEAQALGRADHQVPEVRRLSVDVVLHGLGIPFRRPLPAELVELDPGVRQRPSSLLVRQAVQERYEKDIESSATPTDSVLSVLQNDRICVASDSIVCRFIFNTTVN